MQPFENCADVSDRGIRVPFVMGLLKSRDEEMFEGRYLFQFYDRFPLKQRWINYLATLPDGEALKKQRSLNKAVGLSDVPDYATV